MSAESRAASDDRHPGRRTSAPCAVMIAVPETTATHNNRYNDTRNVKLQAMWVTFSRRRAFHWSKEHEPVRYEVEDYWRRIDDVIQPGQKLWIFSPEAGEVVTLSGLWDRVDTADYEICKRLHAGQAGGESAAGGRIVWMGRHIVSPRCTIVTARRRGCTVQWVSLRNYCNWTWDDLAKSVEYRLPDAVQFPGVNLPVEPHPKDQAVILNRWVRATISHWLYHRYGPWRETAGALSVSLWKTVDGPRAARRHNRDDAKAVEVQATHGGRATTFYYGQVGDRSLCPEFPMNPPPDGPYPTIKGPVYSYDVCSMYPYLLGAYEYPVQLCGIRHETSVEDIRSTLRYWGAIATVTLRSGVGEFPLRIGKNCVYPVGQFTTTLAGPELERALMDDAIIRVHSVCRYKLGRPFVNWSKAVLWHRYGAKDRTDRASEYLWKGIANSFGGKFAQRNTRHVLLPDVIPPVRWGDYRHLEIGKAGGETRRAIAGVAYRREEGLPGHRLPTAVYCYLTAYGRTMMRALRERLPQGTVLQQDTDGLYCTVDPERVRTLSPLRLGTEPGQLRLVGCFAYSRFFTPKHYYVAGQWVLAGYHDGWKVAADGNIEVVERINEFRSGVRDCPTRVTEQLRRIPLPDIDASVKIGPDGWLKPPYISPPVTDVNYPGLSPLEGGD